MFGPHANIPRPNQSLIYFGACIIAGMRLAHQPQIHVGIIPIRAAIEESCELSHAIFDRIFRKVPEKMGKLG